MTAKLEDYFIFILESHRHYTVYSTTILIIAEKCQALYTPLPFVFIDETLVGFRGRYQSHVYIPSTSDRYGLNIWSMCDVSSISVQPAGIPWKGRWVARTAARSKGSDLATLVYGSGHNIATDSFFTSHALAKFLLRQNLTLLCTARKTRKELPSEFVLKKHTSLESVFAFIEDTTSRTPQRQTRLLWESDSVLAAHYTPL